VLDRDGVLNEPPGDERYILDRSQWRWTPRAFDGLRTLARAGVPVVVATNQSCVGQGLLTEDDLNAIHDEMIATLQSEGCGIAAVYVCPHTAAEACSCRKPAPGLLRAICTDFGVDPTAAAMIGDTDADSGACRAVGMRAFTVTEGRDLNVIVVDLLASFGLDPVC
jgi:D-glycero-D-manno-heptose 1,7-bisphosphate phosphatase